MFHLLEGCGLKVGYQQAATIVFAPKTPSKGLFFNTLVEFF